MTRTPQRFILDYKAAARMAHALDAVDRMVQGDILAVEERPQERLRKARELLRDRLRKLLQRAKSSGRT